MREICVLLALAVFVSTAHATPSPFPPADYPGDQYIDGQGCVYNRAGTQWKPRLEKSGEKLCGFPPSLDSRRTDPDTLTVLAPLHPPQSPDPETLLREALAQGLRQGEFTADPRPQEARSEGKLPDFGQDISARVKGLIQARQEIRAQMAGALADSGLCAQLGYRIVTDAGPIIGGDVTQGLCPGMRADLPSRRIVASGRTEAKRVTPNTDSVSASIGATKSAPAGMSRSARPETMPRSATARNLRRSPIKPAPPKSNHVATQEMIPAAARYVEIGDFADESSARPVIHALSGLGFPVSKGQRQVAKRNSTVILAGPFDDRGALVAALNTLRGRGYKAFAR